MEKLIPIFSWMNRKCNLTKNATLAICTSIGIDWRVFCSRFSPAFLVIQGPRHTIGIGYIDSYFTNAVQSWICYFQKLFMSADILSINIMAIIDPNSLKTIVTVIKKCKIYRIEQIGRTKSCCYLHSWFHYTECIFRWSLAPDTNHLQTLVSGFHNSEFVWLFRQLHFCSDQR